MSVGGGLVRAHECGASATSTIPLGSKVAVGLRRAVLKPPVAVQLQLPLAGSYSSPLANTLNVLSSPLAAITLPLGSNVATWSVRAVLRLPVAVQVPPAGLRIAPASTKRSLPHSRCPDANGIT